MEKMTMKKFQKQYLKQHKLTNLKRNLSEIVCVVGIIGLIISMSHMIERRLDFHDLFYRSEPVYPVSLIIGVLGVLIYISYIIPYTMQIRADYQMFLSSTASESVTQNKPESKRVENGKFCTNCGKEIARDVKFCEFCGTKSE